MHSEDDASAASYLRHKAVKLGRRTRLIIHLMRWLLRPWLRFILGGSHKRIAGLQLRLAAQPCRNTAGLTQDYRVLGRVPGHTLGDIDNTEAPVLLYLHGGAFIMPAVPATHLTLVAKLARAIGGSGFMPDYRLAPFHRHPAALDDCENAYRALLERGFPGRRIVVAGESAGGNLLLGLLQRIRAAGLEMPAGAAAISPATEMGRIHAPPSRARLRATDSLLAAGALHGVVPLYAGDHNAADPELSPLYMDLHDLPPILLQASDAEILLDDSLLLGRRMADAGVDVQLDVWPGLPHAFPLFEALFPEVQQARQDIAEFLRSCLRH